MEVYNAAVIASQRFRLCHLDTLHKGVFQAVGELAVEF